MIYNKRYKRLPRYINGGNTLSGITFDSDPLLEHYNKYKPDYTQGLQTSEINNNSFFNSNNGRNLGYAANIAANAIPGPKDSAQTASEASTDQAGTAIAGAIGPWWGALAKVGTTASQYIREDDNVSHAQGFIGDTINPFHQFNSLKEGKRDEQLTSFLNPVISSHLAASRRKYEAGVRERLAMNDIQKQSQNILASYPVYGQAKYGKRFASGGNLPSPTDNSNMVPLASNMARYDGNTHENGGIDLDTNNDQNPDIEVEDNEVIKDDMVLSDRLKPSINIRNYIKKLGISTKGSDTYASVAEKLGKRKGKYEEGLRSNLPGAKNTSEIMIKRLDNSVNQLFEDQEMKKYRPSYSRKYPDGGSIPIYLQQNPNSTTQQNDLKAQLNFINALKFKNSLRGNVVPQLPVNALHSNSKEYERTSIVNSYAGVDPRALQQADSVINTMRPLYGRKYARGGAIADYWINDPFGGSQRAQYKPQLSEIDNYQPSGIGNNYQVDNRFNIGDYRGDIASVAGTIANQISINNMETNLNPDTIAAPRNIYTDRTPYLTNQISQQFRTAAQGADRSGYGNNLALKADLYAKSLEGLNRALDSEQQRKDIFDSRYNDDVNRTNYYNTQIRNSAKFESLANRNQKRALTQANIDNLIRSYQGNEAMRDVRTLDKDRAYFSLLKQGDTGVGDRILDKLSPTQKRRLGLYAKGGIYIKPENRGKFTAWAKSHDMGVQEAASHILANKEDYSSTLVKRANFARNFGRK